ncbi:MAG TPA: hypothetical protein VMV69_27030 [Pirellulales bacterium]|nr:hypothetical protein [Pirellulales bacterium]
MSKLGFYAWIRENVRRAVLLGFSDAVEQLGSPNDGEDVSPQLLAVLRQPQALLATSEPPAPKTSAAPPGRKRLGQTLEQIQERAAKTENA